MTVCVRALALLCCVLTGAQCFTSATQRAKYTNSFQLARSARICVQRLLTKYTEQQLGNKHFEDRTGRLKDLPVLSTDFSSWLQITDFQRLHNAFVDLQAYWKRLDWKRKQLEGEELEQGAASTQRITLPKSVEYIQLDLRDLMSQIRSQMNNVNGSQVTASTPAAVEPLRHVNNSKTVWERRVEGYIILRDLNLYLTKLARDFLFLASQTHVTQF